MKISNYFLQLHLSELKSQQEQEHLTEGKNSRPKSAKLLDKMRENKLYDLPRGISVLVYPNGENTNRALSVIASNMTEVTYVFTQYNENHAIGNL